MTDMTVSTERASAASGTTSSLYRAVWRWHFYAGLFALPFLIILAVTGALYLFHDEIDGLVYADLKRVEAQAASHAQTTPTAAADQAAEEPTARRESATGSGDSPASPNRLTP